MGRVKTIDCFITCLITLRKQTQTNTGSDREPNTHMLAKLFNQQKLLDEKLRRWGGWHSPIAQKLSGEGGDGGILCGGDACKN